jgi:diguanylate cyclase (GGDEF)-like protein
MRLPSSTSLAIQRYAPWVLLLIHMSARVITTDENLFIDLVLFNLVPVSIIISLVFSQTDFPLFAKYTTIAGVSLWLLGSLASTFGEFFSAPHTPKNLPNILYLLFYPLIIAGLLSAMQKTRRLNSVEVLDASIIAIGISALGAAFLIEPVLPNLSGKFGDALFAVIFPIVDLAWLALAVALVLMNSFSRRNVCVLLGILAFSLSDFIFLSLTLHHQYSLGRISDDGWLVGLALLSESFWMRGRDQRRSDSLHPVFIAVSVMMSATLLAITSLRPGYLPDYIVIPTVATLGLAFIRMTIALKQARTIGEERLLARTDELTGLPNRRRFLSELSALANDPHAAGALLLMDLDGFKPINDQFGHEIGDQLLREVSKRFSRALPHGAMLARLGGDEFGALIIGDYESTLEVALALKATLSYPFSIAEHEIRVGVSVGHVGNDGGPDLLRRADMAMYQAKREKVGIWSEPARQV